MMRKLMIALAAVATLAGGIAATTAPAEAKVHVFIGGGFDGYDPYYDRGYYPDDYYDDPPPYYVVRRHHRHHPRVKCKTVRVWHHHHWEYYKKCYRVRY
jgi:hypothetical protein